MSHAVFWQLASSHVSIRISPALVEEVWLLCFNDLQLEPQYLISGFLLFILHEGILEFFLVFEVLGI